MGGNIGAQGHALLAKLEVLRAIYARVIRRNRMLEDDYTCMIIATLMYVMHKKALIDKLEKLRRPYKQWLDNLYIYSLHGLLWTSCTLINFWTMNNMTSVLIECKNQS